MDLLDVLRRGLSGLPDGPCKPGLKAVIHHIEVAIRHLERGQTKGDAASYTDAVYRCNQAYEGSLRELYRAAFLEDPNKPKLYEIEDKLGGSGLLRPKIITQFNRYRQEWRNPSSHDYTLDFDENEAFLAVVNIAAFAKMAITQIGSTIAFAEAASLPKPVETETAGTRSSSLDLVLAASIGAKVFLSNPPESLIQSDVVKPEGQVASAIAGFLSSTGTMTAEVEHKISDSPRFYADLHVQRGHERSVFEFKRETRGYFAVDRTFDNLDRYMEVGSYRQGAVVVYSGKKEEYGLAEIKGKDDGGLRILVAPKRYFGKQGLRVISERVTPIEI